MKRNTLYILFSLVMVLAFLITSCGTPATTTISPTQEIIVPPAVKDVTPVSPEVSPTTTSPTIQPEPTNTLAAKKEEGPFILNGVTLPFKRSETVVLDQSNFSIYDSFNPYIPNGAEFASGFYQISLEYLWYVNYATGDIIPWLADGYDYSSDHKTLTIHIHKGVTWSDGVPFTAQDVAFTANMVMKDKTLSGSGDETFWKTVTAPDDYTVIFEMTESRPRQHLGFFVKICTGYMVMPKHIWEKQDSKTLKFNPPVTTGPYMLLKAYPDNKMFVWQRNENYWNKAKYFPPAKYVIYRTGPIGDQALAEFKADNSDVFGFDYMVFKEKQSELPQIGLVAYNDPCPRAAYFNTAKAPFDKAEFRRAMSMLMNRPKWAENIWIPPSKPAIAPWADYRTLDKYINKEANTKWGTLDYNPDKAKELLAGLGYKNQGGKLVGPDNNQVKFDVVLPTSPGDPVYGMAQDWVEDLKAVGIEAILKHFEGPVFWDHIDNGNYDVGFWWMCGATVDPVELYKDFDSKIAAPIGQPAIQGNSARLKDPEFDAVLNQLNVLTPDDPKAMDLYMKAYDLYMRDAPGVPTIQTYYAEFFDSRYWGNTLSNKNVYTVPFNWWAQFIFYLFKITPKGG